MNATNLSPLSEDYQRVAQAIQYIEENYQQQPDLKAIASHVGLSEYHFQRLFTRWAGISPKRFLQFLTLEHAKNALASSHSILDASYDSGLSSPSRLHDLFVTHEAVTPGEFKRKGNGITVTYGLHETPFGNALIAATERGICNVFFYDDLSIALSDLRNNWPLATIKEDDSVTTTYANKIFGQASNGQPLSIHLVGTNFQIQVWQALLNTEQGQMVSYGTLASWVGKPKASRAVGTAVGNNPIAYLIPCHRVIRSAGGLGQYRWGATRKKALLGWEAAQKNIQ